MLRALPRAFPRVLPRSVAVLGTAALALTASGCGIPVGDQTQEWYDPADGANTTPAMEAGDIAIRNANVVTDGSTSQVWVTLVNSGEEPDGLVAVTVDGTPTTVTGGEVEPGRAVTFNDGESSIAINGGPFEVGLLAELSFEFDNAPATTLDAIVLDAEALAEAAS